MAIPFFLGLSLICLLLLVFCLMFNIIRAAGMTRAEQAIDIAKGPDFREVSTWIILGIPIFGTLMVVFAVCQIIAMML